MCSYKLCIFIEYYWQEICDCHSCTVGDIAVKSQFRLMIIVHIHIKSKELCLFTLGINFAFWKPYKNQIFALIFDSFIDYVFILFSLVTTTI